MYLQQVHFSKVIKARKLFTIFRLYDINHLGNHIQPPSKENGMHWIVWVAVTVISITAGAVLFWRLRNALFFECPKCSSEKIKKHPTIPGYYKCETCGRIW